MYIFFQTSIAFSSFWSGENVEVKDHLYTEKHFFLLFLPNRICVGKSNEYFSNVVTEMNRKHETLVYEHSIPTPAAKLFLHQRLKLFAEFSKD